jgi:hypothetical protein
LCNVRRIVIAAAALVIGGAAWAQTSLTESAKAVISVGTWEFSNAERDKICKVTFGSGSGRVGLRLSFDPECVKLFPLVRDIAGWRFPQDDLLYMLDGRGQKLIEFSEVEDGIFEAPTPGLGLLFLQNPAAVGPPPKAAEDMAGEWVLVRGDSPLCTLTLTKPVTNAPAPVELKSGCHQAIVQLNVTLWRADRGELVLMPAEGDPWRFEEIDGRWRLLSETGEAVSLVKQ